MPRERVSALIIQDHKILLIEEKDVAHRSTPGGGIKPGETHLQTLNRELQEEIGIISEDATYLFAFEGMNTFYQVPQIDHCYIIALPEQPKIGASIKNIGRFSKQDILNKLIKIAPDQEAKLIPYLIEQEIL